MSSSYEKSVKGATKIKLAPPKAKYIEHILQATHTGEAGVGEIFRTLQLRLRDSTWTIAFKALIVAHYMIKDGEPNVTLLYTSTSPQKFLGVSNYTDMQTQGKNIRRYSKYLVERSKAYGATKYDYVRGGTGRLKRLTVDKGLLRETEIVQAQIHALVKCDFFTDDVENEITLTAFRTLVMDLLVLFQVMNEALINILEHYFEMSKPDAERALAIYKIFAKETSAVVKFFGVAQSYEHATRVEIPTIRHAPTSLSATLEEYLHDKDFEINRRQYLAEREAKKSGSKSGSGRQVGFSSATGTMSPPSFPSPSKPTAAPSTSPTRGPAPDLIDFFDSIETRQETMGQQSQIFQQSTYQQPVAQPGFPQTNPFGQFQQTTQHQSPTQSLPQPPPTSLNAQYTGAGFGGYTPQPPQSYIPPQQPNIPPQSSNFFGNLQQIQQPQQSPPSTQSQIMAQQTNPFRQSIMPTSMGQPNGVFSSSPTQVLPDNSFMSQQYQQPHLLASQTGRNPFAHQQSEFQSSPFPAQQPAQSLTQNAPAPLLAQATGTNPFAKNTMAPQQQLQDQAGAVLSQATGSTNPFRQSHFVNQQTGQAWQHAPQFTMGGLEQLETVPVFPRPGQIPTQQPQHQQSPWG